jgi:glucan phosphorylase
MSSSFTTSVVAAKNAAAAADQQQQLTAALYLEIQQRLEEERLQDLEDQKLYLDHISSSSTAADEDRQWIQEHGEEIRAKKSKRSYNRLVKKYVQSLNDAGRLVGERS